MVIEIDDKKTLTEVQDEFILRYPYLKLEFFRKPHSAEEASEEAERYPHSCTLGEIRKKHRPGLLEIFPWSNTAHIEQEFKNRFGLYVQIYRLQKNEWVQTVGTDHLSLKEQNDIGKNSK